MPHCSKVVEIVPAVKESALQTSAARQASPIPVVEDDVLGSTATRASSLSLPSEQQKGLTEGKSHRLRSCSLALSTAHEKDKYVIGRSKVHNRQFCAENGTLDSDPPKKTAEPLLSHVRDDFKTKMGRLSVPYPKKIAVKNNSDKEKKAWRRKNHPMQTGFMHLLCSRCWSEKGELKRALQGKSTTLCDHHDKEHTRTMENRANSRKKQSEESKDVKATAQAPLVWPEINLAILVSLKPLG